MLNNDTTKRMKSNQIKWFANVALLRLSLEELQKTLNQMRTK